MTTLNGVDFTKTGNPVKDLKNYATARGISETEAKSELEAEYGVAEAVKNSQDENNISVDGNSFNLLDNESLLEFLKGAIAKLLENANMNTSANTNSSNNEQKVTIDGEEFTLTGDPEADAQTVADKLGITLDEAKEKLKAELGEPTQPNSSGTDTTTSTTATTGTTSTTSTTSDTSCSSSSSSSKKSEAYYKLCEAEDKFKYAADHGWHNVQDLYEQVQKAKKRYDES